MVWYFFREFSDIFPNNSFAEHHQAAASDFKKIIKYNKFMQAVL